MPSFLDYAATLQDDYSVRTQHRAEPVCDNEDRASLTNLHHVLLDDGFGFVDDDHTRARLD